MPHTFYISWIFVWFLFGLFSSRTSAQYTLKKDPACGINRGCFHDCTDTGCSFLITWSYRPHVSVVDMSLNFQMEQFYYFYSRWYAIGLSHDMYMGDDSIIECYYDHTFYWLADVSQSYNELCNNVNLLQSRLGLIEVRGRVINNTLTCNFTRDVTVANEQRIFSLDKPWYIMVATGPKKDGEKLKHENEPTVSPWKIDLRSIEDVQSQERSRILVKLHACFMIFAWVLISSISIVIARYYKNVWTVMESTAGKIWFKVHRAMMMVCTLMVIAGFVLIWVHLKTLSKLTFAPFYQKAHPILGIIIMGLTILNPLIATLRPRSGTLSRPVFKWTHTFVGTVVYILAILNIIIGVTLKKSPAPFYVIWILLGFAVYQVLFEVFLEMYECHVVKTGEVAEYVNKDLNSSTAGSETSVVNNPPGALFKRTLLFFHTLVIIAIGTSLIVLIAIN